MDRSVRRRRALQRAVVGIADRERVREGVLPRQVGPGEVAHRLLGLGRDPLVPRAGVPGGVRLRPAVVEVGGVLRVGLAGVHAPGLQRAVSVRRLSEDGRAVRELQRLLVGQAAHAGQRAEVVVERAVLLHQDHDVLDVLDRPGARGARRRDGGLLLTRRAGGQQCRRGRGRAGQERTTSRTGHSRSLPRGSRLSC